MTRAGRFLSVALVQFPIAWEDREKNYSRVLSLLEKQPPEKGGVIALPELFATGTTRRPGAFSECLPGGRTSDFLASVARTYSSFVVGSVITRNAGTRPSNTAAVYAPDGRLVCRYDKVHLIPLHSEHLAFRGGAAVPSFTIRKKTFGCLICFDLRFPEPFRILYGKKAAGIVVIANWPEARHSHWEALTAARAIENQCFIFAVNRTGRDPHHRYRGGSCILDPLGRTIASSPKEGIISARIDLEAAEKMRHSFPIEASRQPSVYKRYAPYN